MLSLPGFQPICWETSFVLIQKSPARLQSLPALAEAGSAARPCPMWLDRLITHCIITVCWTTNNPLESFGLIRQRCVSLREKMQPRSGTKSQSHIGSQSRLLQADSSAQSTSSWPFGFRLLNMGILWGQRPDLSSSSTWAAQCLTCRLCSVGVCLASERTRKVSCKLKIYDLIIRSTLHTHGKLSRHGIFTAGWGIIWVFFY